MLKRIAFTVLAVVLLLAAGVAANTWRQGSRQVDVAPAPAIAIDEKAIAEKLAGAVRFKTVSSLTDAELNKDQFLAQQEYLKPKLDLPRLHGTNERIAVSNLAELVRFYHQLIRNASLERPSP
jgi:carboxypeptidase PM20D1